MRVPACVSTSCLLTYALHCIQRNESGRIYSVRPRSCGYGECVCLYARALTDTHTPRSLEQALNHPNILKLYHIFESDDHYHFVLE